MTASQGHFRSPQAIMDHHSIALENADIEDIVADYADDAIVMTRTGIRLGKDGVRAAFQELLQDLPRATWTTKTALFEHDLFFLEWAAQSIAHTVDDGADTFVFRDGWIRAQTLHYTLIRAPERT
jgi:ketosteroid isomerase-like protein